MQRSGSCLRDPYETMPPLEGGCATTTTMPCWTMHPSRCCLRHRRCYRHMMNNLASRHRSHRQNRFLITVEVVFSCLLLPWLLSWIFLPFGCHNFSFAWSWKPDGTVIHRCHSITLPHQSNPTVRTLGWLSVSSSSSSKLFPTWSPTTLSCCSTSPTPPIHWNAQTWDHQEQQMRPQLLPATRTTTALLRISYDGCHFTGWSSANDDHDSKAVTGDGATSIDRTSTDDTMVITRKSRSRRNRRQNRCLSFDNSSSRNSSGSSNSSSGYVRSVQGVLQRCLAKLYGDIDVSQIIVEGCSRTDKGVHAVGMVAQIYCLSPFYSTAAAATSSIEKNEVPAGTNSVHHCAITQGQPSIPGKRRPHPWNATDNSPYFVPLPKPVPELVLALNRMLYPDIQIMAYAPVPTLSWLSLVRDDVDTTLPPRHGPFHPTVSARAKTYRYTFSVGPMPDPTQWRSVWYVGSCTTTTSTTTNTVSSHDQRRWDIDAVDQARQYLEGCHNFAAFQGAPRGSSDQRRRLLQNTTCTMEAIRIHPREVWNNRTITYDIEITGDRFLYKMVRFMVGAMVAVGVGKLSASDIQQFLHTGNRSSTTHGSEFECAPPHALVLQHVHYDIPIEWKIATL
jgi:tRNA pseudouridine(38-40) synthase